jgi:hypothetical protein
MTYQCQACGNLHGAPVEHCGVCGSPAVRLLTPEEEKTVSQPTTGPAAAAGQAETPPTDTTDAFRETVTPLFNEALAYIRERDAEHAQRHDKLDEAENARRDRVAHAKIDLLGQVQTLVDKLTELAESGITYVDTVLLAKKPATPIVE